MKTRRYDRAARGREEQLLGFPLPNSPSRNGADELADWESYLRTWQERLEERESRIHTAIYWAWSGAGLLIGGSLFLCAVLWAGWSY